MSSRPGAAVARAAGRPGTPRWGAAARVRGISRKVEVTGFIADLIEGDGEGGGRVVIEAEEVG